MTKSASWDRVRELHLAALEREEGHRAAFLREACAGDETLFREVLSLLSGVRSVRASPDSLAAGVASDVAGARVSSTASGSAQAPPPLGTLAPGERLAHYEIVSRIGAGGMGEVFRARDLKLGRDVAIKLMHKGLSSKPDRLRRFAREARAAAALNHPSIATIYEVGDHEGTPFISMEMVEGRTLRDLLAGSALPVSEVLHLAVQIASALAKAHAAGIVHRDLKPGNLMVTTDGLAKVLDFGLVKLLSQASDDSEITGEGSLVGTVDYMSPEQAHAGAVDHRSDQFSLGSILYEMASGRRPFKRETAAQTLVAIIRDEPEPLWKVAPAVPAGLAAIVERCLAKDPGRRYASTADLAANLLRLEAGARSAAIGRVTRRHPLIAAAAIAVVAIAGLYFLADRREAPDARGALQQVVPLTSYPGREAEPSFSPDGSQVAFTWDGDMQSNRDVYVKVIGAERPLRLTSDPAVDGSPAWSPDGSRIAFLRERPGGGSQVRLVSPTGGAERPVGEVAASPEYGLAWSPDGRRLAAVDRPSPGTPFRIVFLDAETGAKRPLTSPGAIAGRGDARPIFSPDGRAVAFKRSMAPTAHFLCVVPAAGGEPRQLAPTSPVTSPPAWTSDGKEIVFTALAFVREGASPVLSTRANTGAPPILWRISADGGPAHQLVGSANALDVAVSREGHRLAFTQQTSDWDVWRIDLRGRTGQAQARFIASTRFDGNAQFSPDEKRVAFTSARTGVLEIWVVDDEGGNPQRLTFLGNTGSVGSPRWSPDGRHIAFDYLAEGDTGADVFVVSAAGGPPRRVTTSPSPDVRPSWSSDGRFVYFASHRSGEWQVWKVPSEGETVGSARSVTRGGGYSSIESPDGEHLYFSRRWSLPEDPRNAIWRVPVQGGDEEVVIESLLSSDTNWDVTAKGIYFVDRILEDSPARERWVVRFFSFDERRVSDVSTLRYPPRLAGPALSVSSGGRWLLVSQLQEESDLMLVEDFR